MNLVYYSKIEDYNKLDNQKNLILDLSFKDIDFSKCKKILVKPNILGPYPAEKHVTTHPEFLRWILKYLKSNFKGEIIVGESSGFSTKKAFKVSGIENVCKDENMHYISLEQENSFKTSVLGKEILIPNIVLECDLIVNVPKLKTHVLMKYTGAIKNLYGCIPGGLKPIFHKHFNKEKDFAKLLAELYHIISKDKDIVTIMDGIWGMEGNGPSNGVPINSKIIIASKNSIALDLFALDYIGYRKEDILTHRFLNADFELVDIDNLKYKSFKIENTTKKIKSINFKKPKTAFLSSIPITSYLQDIFFSFAIRKANINKSKCVKCKVCEEICPVDAILNLQVNKRKCISCYCCHEMCQYDAIDLKRHIAGITF